MSYSALAPDDTATRRLQLSNLSPEVVQSEIRAMSVECEACGGINLSQGICDTPVPPPVLDAAAAAMREGHNIYTRLDGVAPLRNAIARKMSAYNHLACDPQREVLVTSGATGALYCAVMALLNPGDEAILFEPFYGYHLNTMRTAGVRSVPVALAGEDFRLDTDALRRAITPKTRVIVVNTPSNPAGKVFTRAELESIAALAIQHDLFVFTDEIYEYFLFDGREHISIATLPGMRERTVTISGFSKVYSITGWRVGYAVADPKWIAAMGYFSDLTYICAPSPFQFACAAGLEHLPTSFYTGLADDHQAKRDQLCRALSAAGMQPAIPGGAYYVLANVSALPGETAAQKARFLLRTAGVAAVAGSAFFRPGATEGENLLRFCFGKTQADLDRACAALKGLS